MTSGKKNRVNFGLKDVHYALITESESGEVTYGTPVHVPGAVTLSLDIAGDTSTFYADNTAYYNSVANNGYTGSLEMAKFPDTMLKDVWGYEEDSKGVVLETSEVEPKKVALMYRIDGDADDERYLLYHCTLNRPSTGSSTTTETKEPNTQSADLTAIPSPDKATGSKIAGKVRAKTGQNTDEAVKANWFTSVYVGVSA